jgi:hypothetical protein
MKHLYQTRQQFLTVGLEKGSNHKYANLSEKRNGKLFLAVFVLLTAHW